MNPAFHVQAARCVTQYFCEQTFKICDSFLATAYQRLAVAYPEYSLINASQWIVPNLTGHASAFFLVTYQGAKIYTFEDMRRKNNHMCRTATPGPGSGYIRSLSVEQYKFIMRSLETLGFPLGVSMDYVNARGKFIRCLACASAHGTVRGWKEFVEHYILYCNPNFERTSAQGNFTA